MNSPDFQVGVQKDQKIWALAHNIKHHENKNHHPRPWECDFAGRN